VGPPTRPGDVHHAVRIPVESTKASSVHPSTNQYPPADSVDKLHVGNGQHPASEPPETAARTVEPDTIVELGHLVPVFVRRTIDLTTERAFHVVDVTDECHDLVRSSGILEGTLTVFSQHTTCAVKINERETCFLEDLRLFMEKLVPSGAYYRHDDFEIRDPETLAGAPEDEPINGHSHIKQMLLGCSSESVPVVGGELGLGRWQRIMFIELDQSRERRIRLQVQGWR
jgi:secondary thiamine-phosphate synthase enzyme